MQHTKCKGVLHNAAYKVQDVLCNAEQKIPSDVLCSLFGFSSALHNQDMVYMDMYGFELTLFLVGWLETGVFRQ